MRQPIIDSDNINQLGTFLINTNFPDYLKLATNKRIDGELYINKIITIARFEYTGDDFDFDYIRGLALFRKYPNGETEFIVAKNGIIWQDGKEVTTVRNDLVDFVVDFEGKVKTGTDYKIVYTNFWIHKDDKYKPPEKAIFKELGVRNE